MVKTSKWVLEVMLKGSTRTNIIRSDGLRKFNGEKENKWEESQAVCRSWDG